MIPVKILGFKPGTRTEVKYSATELFNQGTEKHLFNYVLIVALKKNNFRYKKILKNCQQLLKNKDRF